MGDSNDTHGLNIGALSKLTGVPVETLRTWERRYGFPNPVRDEQGHRVYPSALVEHVRLIDAAIKNGHRASSAISLGFDDLNQLLGGSTNTTAPNLATTHPDHSAIEPWLRAVHEFNGEALEGLLQRDWNKLGAMAFLKSRVQPFLEELGIAWMERRMEVGHEHFASERLRDFLTAHWRPISDRSRGARVVCATLPGEDHYLGLQMAATVLAMAGCRVIYLGADTPVVDIADAANGQHAAAVCISVSVAANRFVAVRDLSTLRAQVAPEISLVVGGRGAPEGLPQILVVSDLDALMEWGQNIAASHPSLH